MIVAITVSINSRAKTTVIVEHRDPAVVDDLVEGLLEGVMFSTHRIIEAEAVRGTTAT